MGFELTTLTITGLQVWCWSNWAKQACLRVSDFQFIIKSCSIEYRNDPSPKSEVVHETKFSLKISYSTHACLAQLDQHQTCKPVMVSVVSSNPTGGNFIFLRHLDANFVQKWQTDLCYFRKPRASNWSDGNWSGKSNIIWPWTFF